MRSRLSLLALACTAATLLSPAPASAQPRMLIGFQDDPSLRWRADRRSGFDLAQQAHAGIVRTTVYWSRIARTRPANAADPFDRAYRFDDLDEFVRNAGLHGMEVMLTIWGTPSWANGDKGENYAPTRMTDLRSFAQALASRYSGRHRGYPFVRYFTVWNESNLGRFLSPQYDPKTHSPVAPWIYARLYRDAYAGIKSGNRRALVGIGETSARGRDRFLGRPGTQETESPARFAQLLSRQRPRLTFDAWSTHPYPTTLTQRPGQKVRWPNVTLAQLPRFELSLDAWFHRRQIPIWITEYGYQTRPQQPHGVSYAQQQAYVRQALKLAVGDPRVQLFVWFVLRDDPTSAWKSGLVARGGTRKPAFAAFARLARTHDGRNPQIIVAPGVRKPLVRFAALSLWSRSGTGTKVGLSIAVYQQIANRKRLSLVKTSQPLTRIGYDGWVSFRVPITTAAGRAYPISIVAQDVHGNSVKRSVLLRVP